MRQLFLVVLTSLFFISCSKGSSPSAPNSPRTFDASDMQTLITINQQQTAIYDAATEAFNNFRPQEDQAISDGGQSSNDSKQKIIESIKSTGCASFYIPLPPMNRQTWNASWIVTDAQQNPTDRCSIELLHDWTYDADLRTLSIYKRYRSQNSGVLQASPVSQILTVGSFKAEQTGDITKVTGTLNMQVDSGATIFKGELTSQQEYVNSIGTGRLDLRVFEGIPEATASIRWAAEYSDPPFFQYYFNDQEVSRGEFHEALSSYRLEEIAIQSSRIRF